MQVTHLLAYVPVFHEGYRLLCAKYPDASIVLFGADMVQGELPRLGRDLRAVPTTCMRDMLAGLYGSGRVYVLDGDMITQLQSVRADIVMPADEASYALAPRLTPCMVTYESVFLRWDKPMTLKTHEVQPHHVVSSSHDDVARMRRATREAWKSADWWRHVGAVAFNGDGVCIGTGFNAHHPSEYSVGAFGNPRDNFDAGEHLEVSDTLHAEAGIVARCAQTGVSLAGATLYVTTFPCINCARLIAEAGVKKVYYRDGYSRLDAETVLKDCGVDIVRVLPDATQEAGEGVFGTPRT